LPDTMGSKVDHRSPGGGGNGVRRRTRTPSALVARELLQAAEAVLVRDGMAGLTVRAVAAEAGVAPMGVYNRLGGKGGLVAALLIRGFDRLREAIEVISEPQACTRLRVCCLRYREFALANPCLYTVLFEADVTRERGSAEVKEHAAACLGVLVGNVELATTAGVLAAPDALEAAQQIWSALHGAVALELKGLVQTPDPAATYQGLLDTVLRGLVGRTPDSTLVGGLRPADGAESDGKPRVGILVGHHRDHVQDALF
jgi:AcrR family transcriptional regulator